MVIKVAGSSTLEQKYDAFSGLVAAFQDMAFACSYAILGDFHLAEDAAQQAFIIAWQKIHQLREPGAFPGWFKKIVLTECNRMTRTKRVRTTTLDDGEQRSTIDDDPQKKLEKDELRRTVFGAIEDLPVNERIAIMLFYLDEQSHADITALLGVPTTTVAKRLHTARGRLKGKLMSEFKRQLGSRRPSRNKDFAEKVTAGLFDEYIGRYRFDLRPELVVTIMRDGERLISESAGQRNELFGRENELNATEFDGRGKFVRNRRGEISHLVYYEFGKEMGVARKIS
jgi:RNA polymerase sigma factor (sigma-70 family)